MPAFSLIIADGKLQTRYFWGASRHSVPIAGLSITPLEHLSLGQRLWTSLKLTGLDGSSLRLYPASFSHLQLDEVRLVLQAQGASCLTPRNGFVGLLLVGVGLLGARWLTLTGWTFWLGFPIFALYIWSARCTICGGGIKLNGRTCARCGHVFSSSREGLRGFFSCPPREPLNPA